MNLTHEAARSNQVICLVAELALHQVFIEVFGSQDLNVSISVDLPHASDHIRGASKQLIASGVPVNRADSLLLSVLVSRQNMRDLDLLEFVAVVIFLEIPQMSNMAIAGGS